MELKDRFADFGAERPVLVFREFARFVFSEVVPVETAFQSEGMRNLELLPGNDTPSAYFVGLHLEATVFE